MRLLFWGLFCSSHLSFAVTSAAAAASPYDTDIADSLIVQEPAAEVEPHSKILPRVKEVQNQWFREGRTTNAAWAVNKWLNIRDEVRNKKDPHPLAIHFSAVELGLAEAQIDDNHRLIDVIGDLRVPVEDFERALAKLASFSCEDLSRSVLRGAVEKAQRRLYTYLGLFNGYGRLYQDYLPFLVKSFGAVNSALEEIKPYRAQGDELVHVRALEAARQEIRTRLEVLVPVVAQQLRLSSGLTDDLAHPGLDQELRGSSSKLAELMLFLEKYHTDRTTAEISWFGRCCYHRNLTDRRLYAVRGFNIMVHNWHQKEARFGIDQLRDGDLFLIIKLLSEDSKKMRLAINRRIYCYACTRTICGALSCGVLYGGACCFSGVVGPFIEKVSERFIQGLNGLVGMTTSAGDVGGARLAVRHKPGDLEGYVLATDIYPEPDLFDIWRKETTKRRAILRHRDEKRRIAVANLKAHKICNAVYEVHSDEEPMMGVEAPVVGCLEFQSGSESDI